VGEPLGCLPGGEYTDHGADAVTDEHHVAQVQLLDDGQDVAGVALERGVAVGVVGGWIRAAGTDVVEQHHPVAVLEVGGDEAPHVLVAPESVGEDHRLTVDGTGEPYVVPGAYGHRGNGSPTGCRWHRWSAEWEAHDPL
jgi:hypothetical protein